MTTLNEGAKAIVDVGLTPVLHQHTGTCIESREETYAVMEAVDTRVLKFGPDIGQLQKGGADPVQVVKDFLPIVHHLHLKDYVGGDAFAGYCPLGMGKVNIPGDSRHDGGPGDRRDDHGRVGQQPQHAHGAARHREDRQGVSGKAGRRIQVLTHVTASDDAHEEFVTQVR